jgi:branched-subunit amino acid transport protein
MALCVRDQLMSEGRENNAEISNRVLLAGGVIFVSGILWLLVLEALNISPWGVKLYISMVLLSAFVADRLFVKYRGKIRSRAK